MELAPFHVVTDVLHPTHDRRVHPGRRSLELTLDSVFRPGRWAARLTHAFRLQGRVGVRVDRITLPPESRPSRPIRIGFASDFHAGATTHPNILRDACRALQAMHPDLLLLGGDFVSVRAAYVGELGRLLRDVKAPHGRFAVLGNHDLRADWARIARELASVDIDLLVNRRASVPIEGTHVSVCGLDDPTRGDPRPEVALDGAEGIRLVLMHSPDGLLSIGARHFDLALCGHTHGGQIAAPGGWPLVVPSGKLSRRYYAGRFEIRTTEGQNPRLLIVSRGVGCSTLPIRVFAAPEVHLLILK